MIYLGEKEPKLYLGTTEIKKAYLGDIQVYQKVSNYTVSLSIDPAGSGTATGAGTYQQGASVTVTAAPGDGYKFVRWTENGQTVSESASYTFTVSGDRALTAVFEVAGRLPAGYTEVEYIQNGTSNNSNYMPYIAGLPAFSAATKIELACSSTAPFFWNSTAFMSIFGINKSTSSSVNTYTVGSYDKQFYYQYGDNSYRKVVGKPTNGGKHILTINFDTSQFSADGASVTIGSNKTIRTKGAGLFAPGNGTTGVNLIGATNLVQYLRIYYLKMWDTSGNLVFELVPCINPSGVIDMYDTVSKIFYKNSNTSTNAANKFIAGPAV